MGMLRRHGRKVGLLVLVLAGGAATGWAGEELRRWFLTSPRFSLEKIEVLGSERSGHAEILTLAGVRTGDNLFEISPSEVARAVEAHPWIEGARVRRRFPRRLEILVAEHEPVLLVAAGSLYYADGSGVIVKRLSPGEKSSLPVVTGLSREDLEADEPRTKEMLRDAVELVSALGHGLRGEVTEIHVNRMSGLTLVMVGSGTRVALGWAPWGRKLERLRLVQRALRSRGLEASEIGLDGERRPGRVVARLTAREG